MDFYDSLQVLPAELSFGARSLANKSDRLPSLTFVSDLGLRFRPGDSSYIINDRQLRRIELRSAAPGDGYQMSPSDGYILKITDEKTGMEQLTPKPLRLVSETPDRIFLRGFTARTMTPFGYMDFDHSDYGMTIIIDGMEIRGCIVHRFDTNMNYGYGLQKYLIDTPLIERTTPLIEKYTQEGLRQLRLGNRGDETYHPLYKAWREMQHDPERLGEVNDFFSVGYGLALFLDFRTVSDIDDIQQIASVAYLFLSKAIKKEDNMSLPAYRSRAFLLKDHSEALGYTLGEVLDEPADYFGLMGAMYQFKKRDTLYKMEYADLTVVTAFQTLPEFLSRKKEFEDMIDSGFFGQGRTRADIVREGREMHDKLVKHLEERVLEEGDIDF